MKGKLYGIGVGPGDPELLTLKAVKRIKECNYIGIPQEKKEACTAYQIVKQALPEIDKKQCVTLSMPMTKEKALLKKSHIEGAKSIELILDKGEDVCFFTLGDPTIYSTYLYLHNIVSKHGYETEIINGIPSFCAVAAKLNIGLTQKSEPLIIVPASYPVEEYISLSGTKVFMKSGKQLSNVKAALKGTSHTVSMVENCGMEHEKIYPDFDSIPNESSYYSLFIAKEK